MVYSSVEYYLNNYGTITDTEEIEKQLKNASRIIDTLTYNRLHKFFPEKCSEWELEILNEVTCEISDFYHINGKDLTTLLNSYKINGVEMKWRQSNANIVNVGGETMLRSTYAKIQQLRFSASIYDWIGRIYF